MKPLILRAFDKRPRISAKDLKYVDANFTQFHYARLETNGHDEDEDNDAASVNTASTNATADDIPGPGRIIDKCIYQFFGRKIERFANRFSMSRLPPARIAQCLYKGPDSWSFVTVIPHLGIVIDDIHYDDQGGARVAGLKSLVRQTQSDSIYRSAAALTALIILSFSNIRYGKFVVTVGEVEPLFHLEALANALDDSNPEKKSFAVLITLARERVYGRRRERLTTARVEKLRRRLIELLDLYRVQCLGDEPRCGSPNYCSLSILGSACTLCHECYYFHIDYEPDNIGNYESLFEMRYFLIILVIHCITSLYRQIKHESMTLEHMILSAYMHWIQTFPRYYTRADVCSWSRHISMIACVQYCFFVRYPNHERLDEDCHYLLPRKMRSAIMEGKNTTVYDQQIQACMPRTRRLISSFDELDREARDCVLIARRGTQSSTGNGQSSKRYSDQELHRTRERAQEYIAREMGISVDVVRTLELSYDGTPWFVHDSAGRVYASKHDPNWDFVCSAVKNPICYWQSFKDTRRERSEWGEYLRSNLEWDWDTASSLKRLFSKPKPPVCNCAPQQEHFPSTTFAGEPGGRELNVTIDDRNSSFPEVVRVQCVTTTGEVKYRRFLAYPSVESLAWSNEGGPRLLNGESAASMPTVPSELESRNGIVVEGTMRYEASEGSHEDCEIDGLEAQAKRILDNQTDGGIDTVVLPKASFTPIAFNIQDGQLEACAFIEEITSSTEGEALPKESKGQLEAEEEDAPVTTEKEARFVSLVQDEMSSDSAPVDSFRPHICYGSKTDLAASDLDAGVLPVTLVNSEFKMKEYSQLNTSPSADNIASGDSQALSATNSWITNEAVTVAVKVMAFGKGCVKGERVTGTDTADECESKQPKVMVETVNPMPASQGGVTPARLDISSPDARVTENTETRDTTLVGLIAKTSVFAWRTQLIHLLVGLVLICLGRASASWM